MQDQDLDRLQELLRVASRLNAAAHASFLLRAEPKRADLRAEATSLLKHDAGRGELIAPALGESNLVGAYRLLDCLGEAPPGRLFRAETLAQPSSPVLVAVAGPGPAAARVAIALRTQAERQLKHEDATLARLLDVGSTEDGRLYAAFEFVEGVPLAEFGDALRLSVGERVALLVELAHAVERAHAAGLAPLGLMPWSVLGTWRDEAPSAALISLDPWPLMALLEPERQAQAELLAGLETSAPEALRGADRGVSTDVFALGALLFEAVTGTPPLGLRQLAGQRNLREELRLAARITAPLASERVASLGRHAAKVAQLRSTNLNDLSRDLRAGMDPILARALSADADQRPPSAAAFAKELEHELARWNSTRGRGLMGTVRNLVRRIGGTSTTPPSTHE